MNGFSVHATTRFECEHGRLLNHHPDLPEHFLKVVEILRQDPYNRSRAQPVKKLRGIAPEDGQYRVHSGHFRFRYDIQAQTVFLAYCGLRREDTYRRWSGGEPFEGRLAGYSA